MRTHNCPIELGPINFEGKCNWCGLDEFEEFTDEENEKTVDEYFAKHKNPIKNDDHNNLIDKFLEEAKAIKNLHSNKDFQGLTDQEVLALFNIEGTADTSIDARIYLTAYKQIEAALRDKNS